MARKPKFLPVQTPEGWRVNVPSNLLSTGTRRRRYSQKAEAEGFIAPLNIRPEVHGIGAGLLTPTQEKQAAAAFKLLLDAKIAITLPEITGKYLVRIKKSKASKPFIEAFETFIKSKQRRPAYKRPRRSRKISEPWHQRLLRNIPSSDIEEILSDMAPLHRNQRIRELRAMFNYGLKKK
jgi:hypothetical protein